MTDHGPAGPRPDARPANPRFSSGPCAKHTGRPLAALDATWFARSHRAPGPTAAFDAAAQRMAAMLEAEGVALDVLAFRDAPSGFPLWSGGTVEASLLP